MPDSPNINTVLSLGNGQTLVLENLHVQGYLQFWDDLGTRALPLLGYPISPEGNYRLEDGNVYLCQYFERARMELHGDQIMLGRLGAEVYEG